MQGSTVSTHFGFSIFYLFEIVFVKNNMVHFYGDGVIQDNISSNQIYTCYSPKLYATQSHCSFSPSSVPKIENIIAAAKGFNIIDF